MTLRISDLSCQRGVRTVLHNVSFELQSGAITTILGPNGAGKTTLLRCIAGLLGVRGSITWGGRDLTCAAPRDRARLVTYVPQEFAAIYPCSVAEFIALSRYPYLGVLGKLEAADEAAVQDAIELLSLSALASRNVCTLSGGEMRRVLLAASVTQAAPLLLLDEPTAALDPDRQFETQAILRRLVNERGVTVIQVMHDINLAAASSDVLLGIRDGAVVRLAEPLSWLTVETLSEVYGKALPLTPIPGRALPAVLPP